jgi:translation initiation factor 3 subunit I
MLLGDSEKLLTGSADATAKVWDVQYGKERHSVATNTSVRAVAFSEGDKEMAYATDSVMGFPATLVIFNLATKKPIREITISGPKITTVAWSLHNKFIYSGHEDGTITAWDPKVS